MSLRYKLTDQNGETYGQTQWGDGVTHEAPGTGGLCGPGWIHVYRDPLLAAMLNPIHAGFTNPRLWECRCDGHFLGDGQIKEGWSRVTTRREIALPAVTITQRVSFGILCAKAVCRDWAWRRWADRWLSGQDRTARAAAEAAWAAAWAAWAAKAPPHDLIALAREAVKRG